MDSSQIPEKLHKRWQELFPDTEATIVERYWADLYIHYTEPLRYYHTPSHINDMFILMDESGSSVSQPFIVSCSIFFHDIIYVPGLGDNEEKSAVYAEKALREIRIGNNIINTIISFIRATKGHRLVETEHQNDLMLFLDLDMAILGAEWNVYEDYLKKIRKEYASLPDTMYAMGRSKFLKSCLALDRIYYTREFFEKFEAKARENLSREISMLKSLYP